MTDRVKKPDLAEIKRSLADNGLFKGLEPHVLDKVLEHTRIRQFGRDSEVFPHGEISDEVYVIVSGKVKVTNFSLAGREVSFQELVAGATFGELSAIDQAARTASVITVEPSLIGVMQRGDFLDVIGSDPAIAEVVLKRLVKMIRQLSERVYQLSTLDVKDRVRAEVLRMSRDNMTGDDTARIRDFPTHGQIASRINTHREAVTRELGELARLGLIEQDKRQLKVSSVSALERLLPEETF